MEFDELLEHLDDLIQLAANERYIFFASTLDVLLTKARMNPLTWGAQLDAPGPTADPSLRKTT